MEALLAGLSVLASVYRSRNAQVICCGDAAVVAGCSDIASCKAIECKGVVEETVIVFYLYFVVGFKEAAIVFAVISQSFITIISTRRYRHFFLAENIVGGDAGAIHQFKILREFPVERDIAVYIIFVVRAQPLVYHEPWVIVSLVLCIFLLNAFFTRLPVIAHVFHAPVCAGPDDHVIDHAVRTVINIRESWENTDGCN